MKTNMQYLKWMVIAAMVLSSCKERNQAGAHVAGEDTIQQAPPVSIAFLDDKSGSVKAHGIPPLTYQDIQPAVAYVVKHGGAVMVGLIAANSDYSTVQVRVDKALRPVIPQAPHKDQFNNIFDYHDAMMKYNNITMPAYREDSTAYVSDIHNRLGDFKTEVNDLLQKKLGSNATDIADAINRSIDFHQTAPKGCVHYTILLSDGIENGNRKVVTNQNQLQVIYLLAGGSTHRRGEWLKACNPQVMPDLVTALAQIGINE